VYTDTAPRWKYGCGGGGCGGSVEVGK